LWCIKHLVAVKKDKIYFTYDSDLIEDGLGAQLQRQFSILALANYLNVNFISQPIKQIAIHPLDAFKTPEEMKFLLVTINKLFMFEKPNFPARLEVLHVKKLDLKIILKVFLKVLLFKKEYVLQLCEVYKLVDCNPEIYRSIKKIDEDLQKRIFKINNLKKFDICVHIRQGVGGGLIYPGQKIPRELDLFYFLSLLKKLNPKDKDILILTDAPTDDYVFRPHEDQIHLWEDLPNFSNGVIKIKGQKIKEFFESHGIKIEIINGGDLLSSLLLMIECDILIMSQSSFSYVAALLNNKAEIFYPTSFWHPPLKKWNKVNIDEYA
jgi:hypothetical protein